MHSDSNTPVVDLGEVHELGDFATNDADTRLVLTEFVELTSEGVGVEIGLTVVTDGLPDVVTELPMASLVALRDRLTEVIGR